MSKKSKRGKSKKYSKTRKYSKSRKSPRRSQKSYQSKRQSKKLAKEIELSKEMTKRMSKKTPMVASSQGIKLLKRSKRNMSKGRPLASARDFLLATSILTAALSPYDPHPMAKKSQIAPDTQVHLDWHKGQFPDKQLTSKQYKKLTKRGKRLATIKEGGGGKFSKKCEGYKELQQYGEDDLPINDMEKAKKVIKKIVKLIGCDGLKEEDFIEKLEKEPYKREGVYQWEKISADLCEMCPQEGGRKRKKRRTKKNRKKRTKRKRRK